MKIQRYIAKDMRSALAQVRAALGEDAVILSSGRIGDDVEVVAAMDFEAVQQVASTAVDATSVRQTALATPRREAPAPRNPQTPIRNIEAVADARFAARAKQAQAPAPTPAHVDVRIDDNDMGDEAPAPAPTYSQAETLMRTAP